MIDRRPNARLQDQHHVVALFDSGISLRWHNFVAASDEGDHGSRRQAQILNTTAHGE